ncbi:MAG: hypothetical protein GVY33_07055, partial [Alphaproteobacteria bacterium]|nr:hypothetical protein [Alphaproteobacteria bacterium]
MKCIARVVHGAAFGVLALMLVGADRAGAQEVLSTATPVDSSDWPGIELTFEEAWVGLPAGYAGLSEPFHGRLSGLDEAITGGADGPLPTVLFAHGSLGLVDDRAVMKWATAWGFAFLAPDSLKLPERLKYSSPVSKDIYEQIHNLRQSEIQYALSRLDEIGFVDRQRMVLAGYSESGNAAARWRGDEFVGRIIYSWSCELNYYVEYALVGAPSTTPVLNIVSDQDPYFSRKNPQEA